MSEELHGLKQEKVLLEAKLDSMRKELESFKNSTHEQRIRALDLKHELREVGFGITFKSSSLYTCTLEYDSLLLTNSELLDPKSSQIKRDDKILGSAVTLISAWYVKVRVWLAGLESG